MCVGGGGGGGGDVVDEECNWSLSVLCLVLFKSGLFIDAFSLSFHKILLLYHVNLLKKWNKPWRRKKIQHVYIDLFNIKE